MLDIFNYSFMVRAFAAGLLVAVIAPFIGSFLVARKYALIGDALAHVSLAGVAIGLLMGIHPILASLFVTAVAAIAIEKLRADNKLSGESTLAIFLSGGLALSIVLITLANGFNTNLFSYLFGSITTVTSTDIWIIAIVGIVVLTTLIFLYRQLVYISFDWESAKVAGIPVARINMLLVVLTAVTVVLSMRIVGALLISALMVIPVVTAMQIGRSFRQTIAIAVVLSMAAVVAGLFASYYLNLPAGGAIVLFSLIFFAVVTVLTKKQRH